MHKKDVDNLNRFDILLVLLVNKATLKHQTKKHMKTIQTQYGSMNLYHSMDELESFTYDNCISWLSFNDPNGCYSIEDQIVEFGDTLELSEMKQLIIDQSLNA